MTSRCPNQGLLHRVLQRPWSSRNIHVSQIRSSLPTSGLRSSRLVYFQGCYTPSWPTISGPRSRRDLAECGRGQSYSTLRKVVVVVFCRGLLLLPRLYLMLVLLEAQQVAQRELILAH